MALGRAWPRGGGARQGGGGRGLGDERGGAGLGDERGGRGRGPGWVRRGGWGGARIVDTGTPVRGCGAPR